MGRHLFAQKGRACHGQALPFSAGGEKLSEPAGARLCLAPEREKQSEPAGARLCLAPEREKQSEPAKRPHKVRAPRGVPSF